MDSCHLKRLAWKQETKGRNGIPLFVRYYLFRTRLFGIYLHEFLNPDPKDPHDHPWLFFGSILLTGNYREIRADGSEADREAGSVGLHAGTYFHRIIPHPWQTTHSLFFRGPRVRNWGFINGDWVSNEHYV